MLPSKPQEKAQGSTGEVLRTKARNESRAFMSGLLSLLSNGVERLAVFGFGLRSIKTPRLCRFPICFRRMKTPTKKFEMWRSGSFIKKAMHV